MYSGLQGLLVVVVVVLAALAVVVVALAVVAVDLTVVAVDLTVVVVAGAVRAASSGPTTTSTLASLMSLTGGVAGSGWTAVAGKARSWASTAASRSKPAAK